MLQTKTVNPDTLELLKKLQGLEMIKEFRLVGGTALALQLGHRFSIDLDLFSFQKALPQHFQAVLTRNNINVENVLLTEKIQIFRLNNIKVNFVDYSYPWLKSPVIENGICMASLEDIAAMKLSAITNRGTRKDFVDIYFLLELFDFKQILRFYLEKYPEATEFLLLKSLVYFTDAELEPMPQMFKNVSWSSIKERLNGIVKAYLY
ncbi:MAG: nucleotidyl transferase AbiEii/AbiGii toxin family protein [Bacteroidales bacterium]|nr:nucleotidyl transferase AbiEii/AbiGii toxin family protein [Bacteroidales bacterium]